MNIPYIHIYLQNCVLKAFCEFGTISDVFETNEKSIMTNEYTICKTSIELIIMLEPKTKIIQ